MTRVVNIIQYCKVVLIMSVLFLCFQASSYAASVTLEWDANTESDLVGYKLHYKTGCSGAPYDGTGATEGDSPIDVGNVTRFTLHGLDDDQTYFFTVSAYDDQERESLYSNEVATGSEVTPGGDGGGGCFITAAAFGLKWNGM
jgi:hypothetical protein